GGFDERFPLAWREHSDLHFRLLEAGACIVREPRAIVVHPVRPAPWGVSISQQRKSMFDALLFKKHPRLYRERIRRSPPWDYYAIVALVPAAALLLPARHAGAAATCASLALLLVVRIAWKRLRHTSHSPAHVVEMVATSALIP